MSRSPFHVLMALLVAFAVMIAAASASAATRGITVNLRTTEKPDAPVGETVQLYSESHALVIGIDEYTNGWPKLSNAITDAELIAAELEAKGFNVELHKDLNSAELATVFKRFFILKGDNPSARLFIWFAGHGATVDGEGYLIPADAPTPNNNAAEFKFASVALRDFGTYMRQAVSKHAYAVFDSCFAGTVFASQRALPPAAITRATTMPVRQFLTSGDAQQTVSDDGTFRKLFIRAINGEERADANADGYLTASELGMFLGDRVTNLTQSLQTPRYGKLRDANFDRGDFVFVLPEGVVANTLQSAPSGQGSASSAEIAFWNSIKDSDSASQFAAYLGQYPEGSFATLAMVRKNEIERKLREDRARAEARRSFTVNYIDQDMVADRTANVRETPFPTAPRVGQLQDGAFVWAVGETRTDGGTWYKVARDGVELGFVYAPLLASVGSNARIIEVSPLRDEEPETLAVQPEPQPVTRQPASAEQQLSFLVEDLLQEVAPAEDRDSTRESEPETIDAVPVEAQPAEPLQQVASRGPPAVETESVQSVRDIASESAGQMAEAIAEDTAPVAGGAPPEAEPVAEASHETSEGESTEQLAMLTEEEAPAVEPVKPEAVESDLQLSNYVRRYISAAENGNTKAALSLGFMFQTGENAPQDMVQAVRWYKEAAKGGEVDAMIRLAIMYEDGSDVGGEDMSEAANWYREAAQAGNPDAQQSLGYLYENGIGVTKDEREAARWYEKAAAQGRDAAQNNLGRMYQLGIGVDQDLDQAILWYEKAAAQGNEAAANNLERLVPEG